MGGVPPHAPRLPRMTGQAWPPQGFLKFRGPRASETKFLWTGEASMSKADHIGVASHGESRPPPFSRARDGFVAGVTTWLAPTPPRDTQLKREKAEQAPARPRPRCRLQADEPRL